MSRNRLLALSLLAVLGSVLSACGDDEDTVAETDVTESPDDTEAPGDTGDAEDQVFSGDLGECGFMAEFATAFDDIDPSELFSGGEEVDFGSFFVPLAEEFQDVAGAAPDDIEGAFQTVADRFSDVADELDGVVIDLRDPESIDREAMAKLEAIDSSFSGEFDAASDEIDAWMEENCPEFADQLDLESFGN